jgi:hypothetical protein
MTTVDLHGNGDRRSRLGVLDVCFSELEVRGFLGSMTKKKVFIRIKSSGQIRETSSVVPTGGARWNDIHM